MNQLNPLARPPYKSAAVALLFCVLLGPVGLLYATFWGGFFMIFLGILVFHAAFFFPMFLFWVACCIWGVGAVEQYNKKIIDYRIE